MDRRVFSKKLLATVSSYALLDALMAFNAITPAIKPIVDHWAARLNEYCADLRKESMNPAEWQAKIELLYQQVELDDILAFIDFNNLKKGFSYPDLGVNTRKVSFPELSGLPARTAFVKKVFGMKKGRAIIPHGHSNMASAHLVLQGEMHLRHYEKIRQEEKHLIIEPTIDRIAKKGDHSSISDEKDNIHWFIANTETAFTFDVIMLDLAGQHYDIHNIDIYEKENLHDGSLRVPILDVESALKKYGKQSHH